MQDSNKLPQPALTSEPLASRGIENAAQRPREEDTVVTKTEAEELKHRPDLAPALRQAAITKDDGRYLIYYTFDSQTIEQAEQQGETNLDQLIQAG